MSEKSNTTNRALRYSEDFRQRAVNMYREALKVSSDSRGVRPRIAKELGIADVTLRDWILKADANESTINSLSHREATEKIRQLRKREF